MRQVARRRCAQGQRRARPCCSSSRARAACRSQKDGAWIDAAPVPGALIINIGEMLEVATNGYLKATNHRVVSTPGEGERISVPYFFNPKLSVRFPKWDLPADLAAAAPGVAAEPANPIHDTYGLNALKSRLRSHPEVTQKYHQHLAASLR